MARLVVGRKNGRVDRLALVARHDGHLHLEEALGVLLAVGQKRRVGREAAGPKELAHVAQQLERRADAAAARRVVLKYQLDLAQLHVDARRVEVLGAHDEHGEPVLVLEVLHEDVGDVVAPAGVLGARGVVPVDVLDEPALGKLGEARGERGGERVERGGGGQSHLEWKLGLGCDGIGLEPPNGSGGGGGGLVGSTTQGFRAIARPGATLTPTAAQRTCVAESMSCRSGERKWRQFHFGMEFDNNNNNNNTQRHTKPVARGRACRGA